MAGGAQSQNGLGTVLAEQFGYEAQAALLPSENRSQLVSVYAVPGCRNRAMVFIANHLLDR